jgi:hypothetical protein
MQFHASAPDGQMQIVTIRDLDGDDVTVDGNHPSAGLFKTMQVVRFLEKKLTVTSMVKAVITTDRWFDRLVARRMVRGDFFVAENNRMGRRCFFCGPGAVTGPPTALSPFITLRQ